MQETEFSEEFRRFMRAAVPTVQAAEFLIRLRERPRRWWAPEDAGEGARYLELFRVHGLVALRPDGSFRYQPANRALARHVGTLAHAYLERPVTLVRMVYALQDGSSA